MYLISDLTVKVRFLGFLESVVLLGDGTIDFPDLSSGFLR